MTLLERIPNTGPIEGSLPAKRFWLPRCCWADPDKTRRHGEGLLIGQSLVMEEVIEDEATVQPVMASAVELAMPSSVSDTTVNE